VSRFAVFHPLPTRSQPARLECEKILEHQIIIDQRCEVCQIKDLHLSGKYAGTAWGGFRELYNQSVSESTLILSELIAMLVRTLQMESQNSKNGTYPSDWENLSLHGD
jgi:hypothetical protein